MNLKKYLYSPVFYIFLLIVGYFSFTKIGNSDFGFHLAQGKYFFENHWQLPAKEVYSYTIVGQTNIILSWLFDVLIYFIYLKLGFLGISLWKVAVFVLLGVLFILRLEALAKEKILLGQGRLPASPKIQRGELTEQGFGWLNQWFVYAATFLFLAAVFPRANVERPYAIGYLCFSLFLLLLNSFLLAPSVVEGKRWRWFTPLEIKFLTGFGILQLFWVNIHSSFMTSIIILIIFAFGLLLEKYSKGRQIKAAGKTDPDTIVKNIKKVSLLCILLAGVSLINPDGWGILSNFFKASPPGGTRVFIQELWPMKLNDFFSALGFFWLLSIIPLIKFWQRRDFKMLLTFLAFAFLGLTSVRFSFDYVVLVAPFCVIEVLAILRLGGQADRQANPACIAAVAAALICGLIFVTTAQKQEHGAGLSINSFPIRSTDFVLANKIQGRMFNTFNIGSSLIWFLYPQYQVFIDTRAQNYIGDQGDSSLYNYFKVLRDKSSWQKLDEKYNFDFAMVEWPYIRDKIIHNSTENNLTSDKWALIFMDSQGLVYLKRTEANKELIEKYEYKYIKPQHIDNKYLNNYVQNPADWSAAVKEFQRVIEQAPDSYRAHFYYTDLLARNPESDVQEIIYHLQKTIELNPRFKTAKDILRIITEGKPKI